MRKYPSAITPLDGKAPFLPNWNTDEKLIRDPDEAHDYFSRHPHYGAGWCLGPSNKVSIDLDHKAAPEILLAEGIDVDKLIQRTPTVRGRGLRLELEAPEGITLGHHTLTWPRPDNPKKQLTLLEVRGGRGCQDALPPSWNPDARRRYGWETFPREGFRPLEHEPEVFELFIGFEPFRKRARNKCPWAPPEPDEPPPPTINRMLDGPSVVRAFDHAYNIVTVLESYGYRRCDKIRFKSPHTKHGRAPGVVLLRCGQRIRSYDTDDVLANGKPRDAFDVYCVLDHGGDYRRAVRAAAHMLGLSK